jgi:hypothetical protein
MNDPFGLFINQKIMGVNTTLNFKEEFYMKNDSAEFIDTTVFTLKIVENV